MKEIVIDFYAGEMLMEATLEIEASGTPFRPATFHDPAEGGEFEIVSATLISLTTAEWGEDKCEVTFEGCEDDFALWMAESHIEIIKEAFEIESELI